MYKIVDGEIRYFPKGVSVDTPKEEASEAPKKQPKRKAAKK